MNEKLRFSWFNIMTFVALVAIGYTTFVGLTYMTGGNFLIGGIGTVVILLVLLGYFMFMQTLKSATFYLRRKLRWEAIMLFLSPVVFAILIIPSTHFFTVTARNENIVKSFRQSISGAYNLLADYNEYATDRIKNLHEALVNNGSGYDPRLKLTPDMEKIQIENIEKVLRNQIYSSDYQQLNDKAMSWISKADQGASTYNVFLLGNTRQIRETIGEWQKNLRDISGHRMKAEDALGLESEFNSEGAENAIKGIEAIENSFTKRKFPNGSAIVFCLVTYMFLLLPYIFQSRNARNPYKLIDLFSSVDKGDGDMPEFNNNSNSRRGSRSSGSDYGDDMGGFTLN